MPEFSLLWPNGQPTPSWDILPETIRDLELEAIMSAMSAKSAYRTDMRAVLFRLCLDPQTILYRQIVLGDLLAQPLLAQRLGVLLPLLDELKQFAYVKIGRGNPLQEVLARARELELLVEIVQQLHEGFAAVSTPLQSTGLNALQEKIAGLVADSQFQEMVRDLPPLLEALRSHASVTIGVNLDHRLRPEAAVLLSVNQERFTESSLLDKLLGKDAADGKGIAPLHRPPEITERGGDQMRMDPLMMPLFQDLAKVLEKVSAPVAQELRKYSQMNGRFLADLHPELIFYVQALTLITRLQTAGLSMVFPKIATADERICHVQGAYNLQLALQKLGSADAQQGPPSVVANDIDFGEDGRIAILTGPNQGGKTTYMQAVGLVQVLAQVGLPVPGETAEISIVDAIFTHYPVEERLELGTGRFGDEAQRLRAIFERVTHHSLVLFNESLSTTSVGEGVYLARDILRALRQIGLRAVFTTHLHELAAAADAINAESAGSSALFSLVASRPQDEPAPEVGYSYQIQPGPPLGRSYAEHIAARYGISDEQLQTLLVERGLLK